MYLNEYFNVYEHDLLIINSNHLVFINAVHPKHLFYSPQLLVSIYIAILIVINSETKCIHLLSSAHLSLYLL